MGKPIANADAQIQCIHQGVSSITSPGEMKLTINGKNTFTSISGTINSAICTQKPPPASNKPCSSFSITSGTASKLTIEGKPVVLQGDTGTSDGSPTNGCELKNAGQSILQTD
jgi:uncharacterized Zn-binding protein involved in type VI secretion